MLRSGQEALFIEHPEIVEMLRGYRCAKLVESKKGSNKKGPRLEIPFTLEEVLWHEFPETGMYVILHGQVLDVSGKFPDVFF